jgi:hypothetical protein
VENICYLYLNKSYSIGAKDAMKSTGMVILEVHVASTLLLSKHMMFKDIKQTFTLSEPSDMPHMSTRRKHNVGGSFLSANKNIHIACVQISLFQKLTQSK